MKKRIMAMLLAVCLALTLLPTAALAAGIEPDYSWYNADDSEYTIQNTADLLGFANIAPGNTATGTVNGSAATDESFSNKTIVAIYNGKLYSTLQEAVNAVPDMPSAAEIEANPALAESVKPEDHVITILKDLTLDSTDGATAPGDTSGYLFYARIDHKALTLDLNGHSITVKKEGTQKSDPRIIATLLLRNGSQVIVTGDGEMSNENYGAMEGMSIWQRSSVGGTLTIKNGTFHHTGALYTSVTGMMYIEGGRIWDTGDTWRQGINVDGYLGFAEGKKAVMTGGAMVGADPRFLNDGNAVAEGHVVSRQVITVGTGSTAVNYYEYLVMPESKAVAYVETAPTDYCISHPGSSAGDFKDHYGYEFPQTVKYHYTSLADAMAAAKPGDTVTLLKDVSENSITVAAARFQTEALTLDLNGHTCTFSNGGLELQKDNTIFIKNGTINGTADEYLIQNYSNLMLMDVTLDGSQLTGDTPYTLSNRSGQVFVYQSTIIGSAQGYAFDIRHSADYPSRQLGIDTASSILGFVQISNDPSGYDPLPEAPSEEELAAINVLLSASNGTVTKYYVDSGDYVQDADGYFEKIDTCTLTFDLNGGTQSVTKLLKSVNTVIDLDDYVPERIGYDFIGWRDSNGKLVSGSFTMTGNATLTAKWQKISESSSEATYYIVVKDSKNGTVSASAPWARKGDTITITVSPDQGYALAGLTVTDRNGNKIRLTAKGSGTYTFTMPASTVTVEAVFVPVQTFADVNPSDYFYDAVQWAAENGITGGVSETQFAPNMPCTRAQIVTFLWRAAGSPVVASESYPFADITADAYYRMAVLWAVENGITEGISDAAFGPDLPCTRVQAVTFLFRYAAAMGMDAVTMQELVSGYGDAAEVPAYALSAVNWVLAGGILQGANGNLMPNQTCTRAQIVTLLYRAMANAE